MLQITYLLPSVAFNSSLPLSPQCQDLPFSSELICLVGFPATPKTNLVLKLSPFSSCFYSVGLGLFAFQFCHEVCSTEIDSVLHLSLQIYSLFMISYFASIRLLSFFPHPPIRFMTFCFALESVSQEVLGEILC